MSDELVHLARRSDGVALVTLDHPRANALSAAVLGRLAAVCDELVADPPGAVVLWGGERIFAAGADITEFDAPGAADRIATQFHAVTAALAGLPRLSIAAISGYALGGGLELALACDLRVASSSARLGAPEILLGVIPGGGGTQRLARLVGAARAKDLVVTGRQVDAAEAERMGLVDRVVAPTAVLDTALDLAATLAAGPLVAQAAAKQAVDAGLALPLEEGLALERRLFAAVFETEDARRGVASFLEHGPGRATFVGR